MTEASVFSNAIWLFALESSRREAYHFYITHKETWSRRAMSLERDLIIFPPVHLQIYILYTLELYLLKVNQILKAIRNASNVRVSGGWSRGNPTCQEKKEMEKWGNNCVMQRWKRVIWRVWRCSQTRLTEQQAPFDLLTPRVSRIPNSPRKRAGVASHASQNLV